MYIIVTKEWGDHWWIIDGIAGSLDVHTYMRMLKFDLKKCFKYKLRNIGHFLNSIYFINSYIVSKSEDIVVATH